MTSVRYVFIDESGDLGIHGLNFFTLAAVVVEEPKTLSKIIKRLRERKLKKKLKNLSEIKANNSNQKIREFVLEKIKNCDCKIYGLVVDKSKIYPHLYEIKDKLYNYFVGILISEIKESEKLIVIMDKKHTNTLIKNFNEYITRKLKSKYPMLRIEIHHLPSYSSNELQVVDFVAWSIHRKFNCNDDYYYNIIEEKIVNKDNMKIWN